MVACRSPELFPGLMSSADLADVEPVAVTHKFKFIFGNFHSTATALQMFPGGMMSAKIQIFGKCY